MKRDALVVSLALLFAAFVWSCQQQDSAPLSPEGFGTLEKKGGGKGGNGGGQYRVLLTNPTMEEGIFLLTFPGPGSTRPEKGYLDFSTAATGLPSTRTEPSGSGLGRRRVRATSNSCGTSSTTSPPTYGSTSRFAQSGFRFRRGRGESFLALCPAGSTSTIT